MVVRPAVRPPLPGVEAASLASPAGRPALRTRRRGFPTCENTVPSPAAGARSGPWQREPGPGAGEATATPPARAAPRPRRSGTMVE